MDRRRRQLEDGDDDVGSQQTHKHKHKHKYRQQHQHQHQYHHYYNEKRKQHAPLNAKHGRVLAVADTAGASADTDADAGASARVALADANSATASSRTTKPTTKGPRRRRPSASTSSPRSASAGFGAAIAAIAATATGSVAADFATPASHHTTPPSPPAKQRTSIRNGSSWLTLLDSDATGVLDDSNLRNPLAPSDATSSCESLVSIVDDPFFLRYDPAFSQSAQQADHPNLRPQAQTDSDAHTPNHLWPSPRRESLTIGSSLHPSPPTVAMESYSIAVIGANGVGKSSLIQRVLGLSRRPAGHTSTVRMVVDNITHMITLFELDLEHFDLNASQPIQWPKQINGHIIPRIDAALIIYDVTEGSSIRFLPQAMTALTNPNVPAILVANKCDVPADDWEVDVDGIAQHKYFKQCITSYKISSDQPDVARACLQAILKAAVGHRKDEQVETTSRRRAQSAVNLEAPDPSGARPISQQSKHSRASSELSALRPLPNQPNSESYRARASRSPRLGYRSADKPGTDYYLDVEESDAESHRYSDDIPILQRNEDNMLDRQPKITGVPFDELVDRLLALRLSRSDNNFSDIFLCLYRKFATPSQLFTAILTRLDRVRDDRSSHYLSKTATQLRIIEIVAKWVSLYPGDFARVAKRRKLVDFVNHLSTEPIFSIASQQMRQTLQRRIVDDDDTGWATAEDDGDEPLNETNIKELGDLSGSFGSLKMDEDTDEDTDQSTSASGNTATRSIQFHSHDEYEREAVRLEPTDDLPMDKDRYHAFMDISDDDIAEEMTRIDWIMFSSIRVRDFIRHVSLSASQKEKCKSLRNVNRMINHFNHIAQWVANLILLREKPKHRALMLEKFMNIALKLRQLNNYNGLAAVLAGVNGTAVHRLSQTRALVPADVQKRFARTVILMGTQKSHFAYRLAWENSPFPRIPFIPLHLRDLVSAEEGSKTFVGPNGDRVNWKKFEVLGEVLLPLMRSQGTAYTNLTVNDTIHQLILNCRMPTDEEDIYQRSIGLESPGAGAIEPAKKKFPWFAK